MAIDRLYKSAQSLRLNNLKRKKHEGWAQPSVENNEQIMSTTSSEAKSMQQDLLKWHLNKILELEAEHGYKLIDLVSAQSRVQHLLPEEETSALDSIVNKICSSSSKAGMITEKMMEEFAMEINSLMIKTEATPENWIKK